MKQRWGREDDAGEFPSDKAVWTIGAFCVALLSVFAIAGYRYMRVWTPHPQTGAAQQPRLLYGNLLKIQRLAASHFTQSAAQ